MSSLGIPASGVRAASDAFAATAVNVANVSAPNAPRQRVDLAEQAVRAGVMAQQRTVDPSSGSVTGDMVDLRIEAGAYGANLAVIRAQDEARGALLDVFA